jgi:hypothetical protein
MLHPKKTPLKAVRGFFGLMSDDVVVVEYVKHS